MSQNRQNTVTVSLLDRKFDIICPPERIRELQEAARYLDQVMRQTQESSQIIGLDRIAVISALNITYELLALKRENQTTVQQMSERIAALQEKIEQTLTDEL